MEMSETGLALTKASEGLRLKAYPDPGTGGEPFTIGYGHTGGVKSDDTCTEEQAAEWLRADLKTAEHIVSRDVVVSLLQHEFDACTDFVFNVGAGSFHGSTLLRMLNQGNKTEAAHQFSRWVNGANGPLQGLVTRRKRERQLFETGEWS